RYPSLVWSWIAIGSYMQSCKHPVCYALESSNLSLSAIFLSKLYIARRKLEVALRESMIRMLCWNY
ncbi:MAG: hypothetical protein ACW98J_03180, partial [Candidatus Thorarchaeota archaeon]